MSELMDTTVKTVLSEEEKETLENEVTELLLEYHYSPTHYGVRRIIDNWIEQKGWLIELMKKHPNYVEGKYMIVFENTYERCKDKNAIGNFMTEVADFYKNFHIEEYKYRGFTIDEIENSKSRLYAILGLISNIRDRSSGRHIFESLINQQVRKELVKDYEKFCDYYRRVENEYALKWKYYGSLPITLKSYDKVCELIDVVDCVIASNSNTVSKELEEKANTFDPSLRAKEGQKISRLVNKLCKKIGFNKREDYDREFAAFADAINPLKIKRHTIISCNLVDYLTMSFGNSWTSCHTIDKLHERKDGSGNNYSGCYSAGTLSYALDNSSVVFYTVDSCYKRTDFELEDKINRCMFHLGEDKLVQGRVYPQCNDDDGGIYAIIRNIAQEVFATCLGVPNLWYNVKGTSLCEELIRSYGENYKDYYEYESCNISFLKCVKQKYGDYNREEIIVGQLPICPSCGEYHHNEECIECRSCHVVKRKCTSCGEYHDEDYMCEIDDNWYCEDCTFYCNYHGRREVGEPYGHYGNDNDNFCEGALYYGSIQQCEECDEYFDADREGIRTEDDSNFCCEECAIRAGYVELEGRWYDGDELYYCEACNRYVFPKDWDSEERCCEDCAARRQRQDAIA